MINLCLRSAGLKPNGPAIKGVCVTRRKHRAESRYCSQKIVTGQGGYGAFFAVQVQSLLSYTSVAVQGLWRAGYKSRYTRFYRKHWRDRGTGITNLSWVQEQNAKNVTIQMTFIVRVSVSYFYSLMHLTL
jgi:hypothetical protein